MVFNKIFDDFKNQSFENYNPSWEWRSDIFNDHECNIIQELKEEYFFRRGTTIGQTSESTNSKTRESKTFFLPQVDNTQWIYDRIAWIVSNVNYEKWQYTLTAMEQIQYTQYSGPEVLSINDKIGIRTHRDVNDRPLNHYDWHIDGGAGASQRKVSIAIQLCNTG